MAGPGHRGHLPFSGQVWRLVNEIIEEGAAVGVFRFTNTDAESVKLVRKANQTIAKVSADVSERFRFNTAISAVMELVNDAYLAKDGLCDRSG